MIDQNTVVHVTYGQQQTIILGKISIFEYIAPQSAGRMNLTISKENDHFDRDEMSELIKRMNAMVEISLISDSSTSTYKVILEALSLESQGGYETLEIGVLRV
ncbi:hypothetical protein [Enterobacter sp. 22466]|uniref:hypothetical protein n=1 Tax=Enterobacter sp. 22466 TaxID=3453924 RepID=UPI003F86DC30